LVTVSERDLLLPTVTLPKLSVVGLDPSVPFVTPVPVSGIVRVGLDAVDVTTMLPVALAADVGVNVTVKVALCPAVSVTGVVMPLKSNPVPLTATREIVTLEPPVLVTVSDKDLLLPTITLPKLRLLGLDPKAPDARPVPDRAMVRVGFEAFEMILTLPLALVADVGVNVTVKVALCPAVKVTGAVIPLRLNAAPLIET
jgi:hypothetical protein